MTQVPRKLIFWLLWLRAVSVKRPQTVVAAGSLLVGAAVASMLLNLYGDVRHKMTQEFRAYGPNIVLAPPARLDESGRFSGVIGQDALDRVKPFRQQVNDLTAAPILYIVVRVSRLAPRLEKGDARPSESAAVVAVGTDFAALRRLNPNWRVEGLADTLDRSSCAIGAHLAARLHLGVGDTIEMEPMHVRAREGHPDGQVFPISNLVSTGSSEDDEVFVPLSALQQLAGLEGQISLVELNAPGDSAAVERIVRELSTPGLEVRPVRQIVYSQGHVLDTIRWLLASLTALILVIISLCIMATMTAILLERRKDIALMKALGASDLLMMELLLSEVAALGLVGGLAGYGLGVLLARDLGWRMFGVTLNSTGWTFPVVCLSSVVLAMLSTLPPVRMVRGIQPAQVLKGE